MGSLRNRKSLGVRLARLRLLPRAAPRSLVEPVALGLARLGLTPNAVTALGFLGNAGAAVLVGQGHFLWGGILLLAAGAMDILDGALARATARATPFGALFDSVVDRLSEAAVFLGLLVFYQGRSRELTVLIYVAATGSFLVSYLRARAEGIGLELREGLFTRAERVTLLALGLIIDQVRVVLWLLAVLSLLTALQRLLLARRRAG
ncbi:MAG TPA: CDP-alcohol phosphatidyltransferase family protein [Dehalococcoidia bacterium]|nr:CDP-alcohol phosphatidyltransferase family protein [Dehalococcoidia bacterium]